MKGVLSDLWIFMGLIKQVFIFAKKCFGLVGKDDVGIIKKITPDGVCVYFFRLQKEIFVTDFEDKCLCFDVMKTGIRFDWKICRQCYKLLIIDEFSINQNGIGDRKQTRPLCKVCRKDRNGKEISKKDKEFWEKKRPKDGSLFKCPCGCDKQIIVGVTGKVALDHNHKIGKVRGYVLNTCNTGFGKFDDDPSKMRQAAAYLERFNGELNES